MDIKISNSLIQAVSADAVLVSLYEGLDISSGGFTGAGGKQRLANNFTGDTWVLF